MSKDQEKQDNEKYSKNFTRIPNILFASYKKLTKEEKFLYCTLREVYWDMKPRFVSLRDLSELTDYSIGALSKMLPRLNTCGLIHAEKKKEKGQNGKEKGNSKYHISIPDIWELNRQFFDCSPNEQFEDPSEKIGQPCSPNEQVRSPNEQPCSPNDTRLFTKSDKVVSFGELDRAQVERAKDSKDIFKDSKKERMPSVTSLESEPVSSVPSFTHSSSFSQEKGLSTANVNNCLPSVDNPHVHVANETTPDQSYRRDTEPLNPPPNTEATRVFNLLCEVFYAIPPDVITEHISKQCASLAPHVRNVEDMKSLKDYTRTQIMDDPSYKKKQVHLGNLVSFVNGWKQEREPAPVKNQDKPKRPKMTREYLDSLPK